ncbi:MAG: hypothetical protein ACLPVI_03005, partial [Dehalococcoidales bacterium]
MPVLFSASKNSRNLPFIHQLSELSTFGWALSGRVLTDIYRPVWCSQKLWGFQIQPIYDPGGQNMTERFS